MWLFVTALLVLALGVSDRLFVQVQGCVPGSVAVAACVLDEAALGVFGPGSGAYAAAAELPPIMEEWCGVVSWFGSGRRAAVVGGVGALAVLGGVLALCWPGSAAKQPAPRARGYSPQRTCLLVGARGLLDPRAAAAWQGLRDASATTRAQATYLSVAGAQTGGNAAPYLASLAQGCSLVVAVGPGPVAAVGIDHARFPKAAFAIDGSSASGANVVPLRADSAAELRTAVAGEAKRVGVR